MATLKLVLLGLLPLASFASRDQADDVVSGDWEPERAEAFVQHKRSHSRGGRTHCNGESLRDHCPRAMGAYLDILKRPPGQLDKYKARLGHGDELLKEMKDMDPKLYNDNAEARKAFDAIRHVDARKVLAFKETWTQEDSQMLKTIGQVRDGWTDGPFSHTKFIAQLPSISILEELIQAGPMAIVGAGPSLTKKGDDIDGHPTVVRFNNHIGNELSHRDTGMKMTVHVINGQVDFGNEPGVVHFDLESTFPGSSMCKRWHRVEHKEMPKDEVTILFRPSAVCGMPEAMASFTRGFLFYWLVGRLAEHSDNYGMGFRDGLTHRVKDESMVNERFLEFEHGLYKAADRLLARKAAEEQSKAAALAATQAEEAKAKAEADANTTKAADPKDAPTTAAPASTEAPAPTTAAPEKEEAKATTVAAKEDKAAATTGKVEADAPATTAAPKKEADAATTAAARATTGKAEAATTAAEVATTAMPVVTTAAPLTAEAAVTTAAAEADASPTSAAPKKEAEAAGTTVAAQPAESNATEAEGNTTKAEGKATKAESNATEPDEADSMKGDEGEEQAADEEEEEKEEQKEDEEPMRPAEKAKDKMHHKMKHMKSGATSTSAFALASLISVATWMLHM